MEDANEPTGNGQEQSPEDPSLREQIGDREDTFAFGRESDTLLSPTRVIVFGRPFTGLVLTGDYGSSPTANNPLSTALRNIQTIATTRPDLVPQLARIYGLTFMGTYCAVPSLPVMLVYGPGRKIEAGFRDSINVSGIAHAKDVFFKDVLAWQLDSLDIGIRIDVNIGWLSDILLSEVSGTEDQMNMPDRPDLAGRAHAVGGSVEMMRRPSR